MKYRVPLFIIVILCLFSCASRDKIVYYKGIENLSSSNTTNFNPILKADDLLFIIVTSSVPEAVQDFNLGSFGIIGDGTGTGANREAAASQLRLQTYLIDKNGAIQFPVLGTIQLAGLTRDEAVGLLKEKMKPYTTVVPMINLRILNFKVTVQGEVTRPGIITLQSERITLPEAITAAGDMTIYGRRDNVLIIRELNGVKTHNFVDMTKADFLNSPFYYLEQNDLVYVEPNKTRMNSSVVGPNISIALSALSLLITVVALLIR